MELMKSDKCNVFVSVISDTAANQTQVCFMPVELIKKFNFKIGDTITINLKEDIQAICQIIPIIDSYCRYGYQLLVSHDLHYHTKYLKDLSNKNCEVLSGASEIRIKEDDIILKDVREVCEIDIIVLLSMVETVLDSRKYFKYFKNNVKNLIMMYKVKNNYVIDCSKNSFAKSFGVSYIIAVSMKLSLCSKDEVNIIGEITKDTRINIAKTESIERHSLAVDKPVLLGGLNHIIEYIKTLVNQPWSMKEDFNHIGISPVPSPGILLIGPPGCGKSSLVRQLCLETQACLIATSGAELQNPDHGKIHLNLSKIASRACLVSNEGPCIFFIDEIDSLCPSRDERMLTIEELQMTAQVLLTIDECGKYPNLLLIAATNRPYALDSAVRRSGRLEIEILLNIPTEDDRKSILQVHLKNVVPDNHSSLGNVAHATPGFVGADLKLLCQNIRERMKETDFNADCIESVMLKMAETVTPSIHKSLDFITSKPKETPIGGLEEVKQELEKIIALHSGLKDFARKFKLKRPKGILLYGPRGCGKTRLVSSVASRKGFTFISANASHLLSPYVGVSEKRVAALFHAARLAQPSVIFIDEIDGIFGSRETPGVAGVRLNLLSELLQAMDGADVGTMSLQGATQIGNRMTHIQDGVLVCAATNNPQKLDAALLRPGRFDHLIYVPLPDEPARLDILKIKTAKLDVEDRNTTLQEIACNTEGWSGAELETLVSQVVMKSVLKNMNSLDPKTIFISRTLILAEERTFTPSISQRDIKRFEDFRSNKRFETE